MPTHGECANYLNGMCTRYGIRVSPNAPACPNFRPRTFSSREIGSRLPMAAIYPGVYPANVGPYPQGRRGRHRRRHRRRRGWL